MVLMEVDVEVFESLVVVVDAGLEVDEAVDVGGRRALVAPGLVMAAVGSRRAVALVAFVAV